MVEVKSVQGPPPESHKVVYSDIPDATNSLFRTQDQILEILHLLRKAYGTLEKHQCHASNFEIAYWQEHRKLQEAIEANGLLTHQLEQLRSQPLYRPYVAPSYLNTQHAIYPLETINEEREPAGEESYWMPPPSKTVAPAATGDTGLQARASDSPNASQVTSPYPSHIPICPLEQKIPSEPDHTTPPPQKRPKRKGAGLRRTMEAALSSTT